MLPLDSHRALWMDFEEAKKVVMGQDEVVVWPVLVVIIAGVGSTKDAWSVLVGIIDGGKSTKDMRQIPPCLYMLLIFGCVSDVD